MKYAVILSNVGSCADRYMSGGYSDPYSLDQLFERLASIDNVSGVELVGTWHVQKGNAGYLKGKLDEYRLEPVAIIPDHFGTRIWGKGAFTSPDESVHKAAIQETMSMVQAAKEIGCPLISIWNGQDGYDYPLQANYLEAARRLTEGLAECASNAPDIRFSLEYKPKEPRNHSFIPNIWSAIVYAKDTGCSNIGITIDVGHAFEAYENVSDSIAAAASRKLLFHMHINDNYRLWDDDLVTGSIHTIEYLEMFYWLDKVGYDGYISIDQYPYREDSRNAADESIKWLIALEKAAKRIDMEKMDQILDRNDALASTAYIRELIFG